ncbi:MAG: DUF1049 domain-containing protein [Cyanobacteria bacterium P01_F01_bin.150]
MRKPLTITIITFILGLWIVAIAILSAQNVFIADATGNRALVTLSFLGISSIPMPFGVVLAISAASGIILTGIALLSLPSSKFF